MYQPDLRDFLMYFHTNIRNIGLYTSLAYWSLAYSRFYRNHIRMYDLMLIMVSLTFLAISFMMNYFLYNDTDAFINKNKSEDDVIHLLRITQAVFGIQAILFILGLITLFRSLLNTK